MATILAFRRYKTEIEDRRDITENIVRDSIRVKTSSRVNWSTLRKMPPIPQWNQEHSKEPGFYLDYVKPNHVSRLIWELEAEYTPIRGGQIDPNPLARPADITFSSSLIEQPTFFDFKRRPIVTTAGEFITGVVESIPLIEYSVAKNLPEDPDWLQTHLGAVNQDTVKLRGLKWPPKTLLLSAVSGGAFTTENRSTFTPFNLTLIGDIRTWTHEVWNRGTVQLIEVSLKLNGKTGKVWIQSPITEGDPPEQVQDPVPLDAKGRALQDYLESGGTSPIKAGRMISLKFETQTPRQFAGVLPLV